MLLREWSLPLVPPHWVTRTSPRTRWPRLRIWTWPSMVPSSSSPHPPNLPHPPRLPHQQRTCSSRLRSSVLIPSSVPPRHLLCCQDTLVRPSPPVTCTPRLLPVWPSLPPRSPRTSSPLSLSRTGVFSLPSVRFFWQKTKGSAFTLSISYTSTFASLSSPFPPHPYSSLLHTLYPSIKSSLYSSILNKQLYQRNMQLPPLHSIIVLLASSTAFFPTRKKKGQAQKSTKSARGHVLRGHVL